MGYNIHMLGAGLPDELSPILTNKADFGASFAGKL
jgi:hypothetical protein